MSHNMTFSLHTDTSHSFQAHTSHYKHHLCSRRSVPWEKASRERAKTCRSGNLRKLWAKRYFLSHWNIGALVVMKTNMFGLAVPVTSCEKMTYFQPHHSLRHWSWLVSLLIHAWMLGMRHGTVAWWGAHCCYCCDFCVYNFWLWVYLRKPP